MSSVALIGPDGAGKTTLARRLLEEPDLDARYLYMGISTGSSNVALPTTRLVSRVKRLRARGTSSGPGDGRVSTPGGGGIRAAARLLNRVAEEWYRALVSRRYQRRGHLVVYDRYYPYDFRGADIEHRNRTLDKRIHRWLLDRFYPEPDLVIFLDAPGEVLYRRKGEKSPEALEARRRSFLRQGAGRDAFVRVDATRPPEDVYAEVRRLVVSVAADGPTDPRSSPGPTPVRGGT